MSCKISVYQISAKNPAMCILNDLLIIRCSKVTRQPASNEKQEGPCCPVLGDNANVKAIVASNTVHRRANRNMALASPSWKRRAEGNTEHFYPNQEDTIRTNVYMDTSWNNDRHKPPLSFGMKILSEWAVSEQNLPKDVLT